MTPCPLPRVGRRHGVFASDVRDARVGTLVQLRVTGYPRSFTVSLRGGVPPLRRWGALRMEPPLRVTASAVGGVLLCGAPITIDTGALRTEPPLRVTASAAEITSSPRSITAEKPSLEQPLHELMTFVMCRS